MRKIYFIQNGDVNAYVAATDMNAALFLAMDENKGIPGFEINIESEASGDEGEGEGESEGGEATESTSAPFSIREIEVLAIEKVAREEAVKVYAKKLSNGKIILVPVTEAEDIIATIAKEDQEIREVYMYAESAYLIK